MATTASDSKIVPIRQGIPLRNLSEPFTIAHGVPIITPTLRTDVDSPQELHSLTTLAESEFLKEMRAYSAKIKVNTSYPGLKHLSRITQKAMEEKGGDAGLITDGLRIAFIASRPSQIEKTLEMFSPAKNSRVLLSLNQFEDPDPDTGMRRAKIIYAQPVTLRDGTQKDVLSEIQVWSQDMLEAYAKTHDIHNWQRGLKACLFESSSVLAYTTIARFEREKKQCGIQKHQKHDEAAAQAGLGRFENKKTFGEAADGMPFMAVEYANHPRKQLVVLRPDLATGTYVEDNALVPQYVDKEFNRISKETFMERSHKIGVAHSAFQGPTHPAQVLPTRTLGRA